MVENQIDEIESLEKRISEVGAYLHVDEKRVKVSQLEDMLSQPGFWDDASRAQDISKQSADLKSDIDGYDSAVAQLEDAQVANELAVEEDDESLSDEVRSILEELTSKIDELELSSWFDGEFDHGDAIVTVTPGQGGLEAQDWTDMLFHMYLRYAQRRKWDVKILDAPTAEVIGIDRATFEVRGHNAYGMLTSEQGVHRLVRISPTDDKKRRQTTFAGVEVLPVLPDEINVEINPNDLRIDVYRSSGPGGQSVNTTDSAVRITHLPTKIVVTCQNEKSQIQNKETAMKVLKAKLYELEKAKREAEIDELRGEKKEISFGSQIRNYVLYPYQMVKDVRTGVETGNVDAVLDGDLDQFVIEYHRWRVSNKGE